MVSWMTVTKCGGIIATATAAITIAGLLLSEGERRLALWWCLLFTAGLAVVIATKMAFIGWAVGIRSLDFTGASGHAMRATAVAPVIFYLLAQNAPRAVRVAAVLAGIAFGVIVGISRLVLHAHSPSEVVAGCLLGAAVGLGFIRILHSMEKPLWLRPAPLGFGMAALVAAVTLAHPVPTQHWLIQASLYISGHDKPFVRYGGTHPRAIGAPKL